MSARADEIQQKHLGQRPGFHRLSHRQRDRRNRLSGQLAPGGSQRNIRGNIRGRPLGKVRSTGAGRSALSLVDLPSAGRCPCRGHTKLKAHPSDRRLTNSAESGPRIPQRDGAIQRSHLLPSRIGSERLSASDVELDPTARKHPWTTAIMCACRRRS